MLDKDVAEAKLGEASPEVPLEFTSNNCLPSNCPAAAAVHRRNGSIGSDSVNKAAVVATAAAAAAAAPPPPRTAKDRLVQWGRQASQLWWELPTACKATMIVAVINFCLSVTYATVAVALTTADEELHITLIILISGVFVVFSVADAIVYENTLELASSVVIDTLVLARVIFFAFEGQGNRGFKIAWCTIMLIVQTIYIFVAVLAYREFGWRLYSKLGVDFREKGAAAKMRLAILRNTYATLLKINIMLLLVLVALGIDVSVEKRGGNVLGSLLGVSLAGLFICIGATWLAVLLVARRRQRPYNNRLLVAFHATMALSLAQPIATIVIYQLENNDVANASISLHVAAVVFMVTSLGVWIGTHLMYRRLQRDHRAAGASQSTMPPSMDPSVVVPTDPLLSCMHAGAWIGKPSARNANKVRFFQLSHDGSTLRWGWNKFVRLYYTDDLSCDDAELTITLSFPFDAELVLKFRDASTYHAWRQGLAHLLLMLMAPDARPPVEAAPYVGGAKESKSVVLGNTSSRQLLGFPGIATMALVTGSPAAVAAPAGAAGDAPLSSSSARARQVLAQLGVRVQQMSRRLRQQSLSYSQGGSQRWWQRSESGANSVAATVNDWDDEAAVGVEPRAFSASLRSKRPPASTQQKEQPATPEEVEKARERRQEHEHSLQMQKRQRMAAYLQSIAAAAHPTAQRSSQQAALGAAAAARPGAQLQMGQVESVGAKRSTSAGHCAVSVGVQTDESELLQLAGSAGNLGLRRKSSSARRMQQLREEEESEPATLPDALPATLPASAATLVLSDGGDAAIAAQYAAAMAAAATGPGPSPPANLAIPPAAAEQQQTITDGGDADIAAQHTAALAAAAGGVGERDANVAAQYMAAMAAAMGTAPQQQEQPPMPHQQQEKEHQQQPQPPASVAMCDSDLAAQYALAMQPVIAVGPSVAAPPPLQYTSPMLQVQQQLQQRSPSEMLQGATPRASLFQHQLPRRSLSSTSTVPSPLEQLAFQQQQAASARLASLTLGAAPYSQPLSPSVGGGLWQLVSAVDVIDYEELSFGKLLGAGAEGAVYAAWFLESPVAVKKFERAEDSLHEVEMYLQLGSHDNVVALRGLCQHEGSMYLVLEYCPRGTLDVMLHHSVKHAWDTQKLLPLVRSIARGMHYLHSRNILHRDLKPANIFVGHGQMMKIGDFGMARIVGRQEDGPPDLRRLTPGTVGTMQYCAPELINEDLRPQGEDEMDWALKLDVWSFGVTVWEILERRRPFEGLTQNAVQAQWMSDPYAARLPPVRLPEYQDRASKRIYRGLSDLVEDCTRLDPYARPSSRDILLRLKSLAACADRKDSARFQL